VPGGDIHKEADRLLMARYLPPSVLVNGDFEILHFRGDTAPFLTQPAGKPHLNLLKLLREGLLTAVRGALLQAKRDEAPVRQPDLRVKTDGGYRDVCVEVVPVRGESRRQDCYLVLFEEGGVAARAAAAPVPAVSDLPEGQRESTMLKQELAATREYLQSVIDQQETANEQLQSANEEVQSANEELQSTNEELETSKEEIQSTNEELATVNDELQHRNLELTEANNDFLNLLNSVQMAIVMLGPDLRIRRFTPAAERLFNLIPSDLGRSISDFKLEIDVPDLETLVTEVLGTGTARQRDVRDRKGRWYSLRLQPYRTLKEGIAGVVIVLVDIDEVKSAETSLRHAQKELAVVDRDKDRFLAMLAHELRNPLAPLRNIGAVLKASHADPDTLEWASGVVDRQIHTMARLIDDLLEASRVTRGKVQLREALLDLREVFDRVLAQVGPQIEERGQQVDVDVPGVPLPVWGDAVRLEQVFGNLLGNASKFSPQGGHIRVETEIVEAEGATGGRQVVTRITDTGIGMEPGILEKIFELFVQADASLARPHGGLGIGLTIARQLTELHRGTLRASSPGPGRGSTFEVRLPLLVAGVESPPPRPAAERRRRSRSRRVLVVDDNRDAAESLSRLLRSHGHVVEQTRDPEQALEIASGFRPEIAVLDIGLPRIDGYELARRLRAQHGKLAPYLVAVSGYGQESDFKRSTEAGFDVHLVKPIEPEVLLDLLERAP
jgi:two-component system CheB/CheR fusion protein